MLGGELGGVGRRVGRSWEELGGVGKSWEELGGVGKSGDGLGGLGRRDLLCPDVLGKITIIASLAVRHRNKKAFCWL